MSLQKNVFFIALIMSGSAFAAGSGGGSALDLKWKAVNFILVFGPMLWFAKNKLTQKFIKDADDITEQSKLAAERAIEAEKVYSEAKAKLDNVQTDIEAIFKNADEELKNFEEQNLVDTKNAIERLKKDGHDKVKFEKDQAIREINSKLIDEVIAQASQTVKNNDEYQSKATCNLVTKIQ